MNPLQQSGDVESNPGPPKVAKVSNNKSARAMVHLNGHGDQNGHEEVAVDQDGVRSVLEKQAELINQQKEDIVELRKKLEDNVRYDSICTCTVGMNYRVTHLNSTNLRLT